MNFVYNSHKPNFIGNRLCNHAVNAYPRLHEFRVRHYSAQYMTLTVQSQHSLDTLQVKKQLTIRFVILGCRSLLVDFYLILNFTFKNFNDHFVEDIFCEFCIILIFFFGIDGGTILLISL